VLTAPFPWVGKWPYSSAAAPVFAEKMLKSAEKMEHPPQDFHTPRIA
jgi:hypothetical protein